MFAYMYIYIYIYIYIYVSKWSDQTIIIYTNYCVKHAWPTGRIRHMIIFLPDYLNISDSDFQKQKPPPLLGFPGTKIDFKMISLSTDLKSSVLYGYLKNNDLHQMSLLFLFYYLLKPNKLPDLIRCSFDTSIHIYTYTACGSKISNNY